MKQIVVDYDETPTLHLHEPLTEYLSGCVSRGGRLAITSDSSILPEQETNRPLDSLVSLRQVFDIVTEATQRIPAAEAFAPLLETTRVAGGLQGKVKPILRLN